MNAEAVRLHREHVSGNHKFRVWMLRMVVIVGIVWGLMGLVVVAGKIL